MRRLFIFLVFLLILHRLLLAFLVFSNRLRLGTHLHPPFVVGHPSFFSCVLENDRIHHGEASITGAHPVLGNVSSFSIKPKRRNSMGVDVQVFIVLPVPALVVQVEKVLPVGALYHQLNCRTAPDQFCIAHVNSFPGLDSSEPVAIEPFVIFGYALLPAFELLAIPCQLLRVDLHLDGVVDDQRHLEHLLPDGLAALGAVLLANKAFGNALVTKAMAADGYPASNDEVHANRAGEALDCFEGFDHLDLLLHVGDCFFLMGRIHLAKVRA